MPIGRCHKSMILSLLWSRHWGLLVIEDTITFLNQLATRLRLQSEDPLEYLKLCQQISVCTQNFNCAYVLGCCTLVNSVP